jgi:hypothetical protein
VACLLKARIAKSGNTSVARQWLCKHHVTADYCSKKGKATIEKLLEVVFSVPSAAMATSHYNKATARRGVFCVVCAKAI